MGNSLPRKACVDFGLSQNLSIGRYQGIGLWTMEEPRSAVLRGYLSVKDHPEVAARELDRLADVSKILWRPEGTIRLIPGCAPRC